MIRTFADEAREAKYAHVEHERRYTLPDAGRDFSLDRFEGALAGLEMIEIEWPDDFGLRALERPECAASEVSADPHYRGGALTRLGIPKEEIWPSS